MSDLIGDYAPQPIFEQAFASEGYEATTSAYGDGVSSAIRDDQFDLDNVNFDYDSRDNAGGANSDANPRGDAALGDDESMADILGIDNEVTRNTSRPRAKLDKERILGANGLPALSERVIGKIKLKGKGHELRDLDRVLEQYQFWAHTLFPKAKFDDFIVMMRKKGSDREISAWRRQMLANEQYPERLAEQDEENQRQSSPSNSALSPDETPGDNENTGPEPEPEGSPGLFPMDWLRNENEGEGANAEVRGNVDLSVEREPQSQSEGAPQESLFVEDDEDDDIYVDHSTSAATETSVRSRPIRIGIMDDDDDNDDTSDKENETNGGEQVPSSVAREKTSERDELEERLIREAEELGF